MLWILALILKSLVYYFTWLPETHVDGFTLLFQCGVLFQFILLTNLNIVIGLHNLCVSDSEFATNIISIIILSIIYNRLVESFLNINLCSSLFYLLIINSNILLFIILGNLLELISIGFRSLSLGFRFLANLSAGHVLSDLLFSLKYINCYFLYDIFNSLYTFFIFIYEFFVLLVQTSVYTALLLVYSELM